MKLIEKLTASKGKNKKEKDTDVIRKIRLSIPAQCASITPPLGPTLGQFGINVMEFCKQFNGATKIFDAEVMLNVVINLYRNKTFTFVVQRPSVSFLVYESILSISYKNFLIQRSNTSGDDLASNNSFIGSVDFFFPNEISLFNFYEIIKFCSLYSDLNEVSLAKSIRSSLRSMGIKVILK